MANETPIGLVVGDRAQGYEVRGPSTVSGLDSAYAGLDARDRDADITLVWLAEEQDQSAVFDSARTFETINKHDLIGSRTVVRFGAGLAAVIAKEHGGPLDGETLENWLKRNAPVSHSQVARLFLPIVDGLTALHEQGYAHGMLSACHLIMGKNGKLRLLGSWMPNGAGPAHMVASARAPELNGGERPNPASDIYSLSALLIWALSGTAASSADARTAARAQHDDDPFVPLSESMPSLDPALANVIDTGMRLHPAVRPQGLAALKDALEAINAETKQSAPQVSDAPPPLPTQTNRSSKTTPPPVPTRGGGVPSIPRQSHTSTIGQRPPPLPGGQPPSQPRKRKLSVATVVTFVIALAVAWFIASDGQLFSDDEGLTARESQRTVESSRPNTTNETTAPERPATEPRKGPSSNALEEAAEETNQELETAVDGVLEQFCSSTFIYNQARDTGDDALRAYLDRCSRIDGPFVDDARRELGL